MQFMMMLNERAEDLAKGRGDGPESEAYWTGWNAFIDVPNLDTVLE